MESVLNTEKGICYFCQVPKHTHLHHIIHAGISKKKQEKMGLICYLCLECHTGTNGVHGTKGAERDQDLKRTAQYLWEAKYIKSYPYEHHAEEAAREEWMKQIGRNYL